MAIGQVFLYSNMPNAAQFINQEKKFGLFGKDDFISVFTQRFISFNPR
jgi:hypothetical protein